MKKKQRSSCLAGLLIPGTLAVISLLVVFGLPAVLSGSFGEPSPGLNAWQRTSYGLQLVFKAEDLSQPRTPGGGEQIFSIESGESVSAICAQLEAAGLIRSAATLRTYLLWRGLDTVIQTGSYRLNPGQTGFEIAAIIATAGMSEVTFAVLPGWRMEEAAASLPTSGLSITPQAFLAAAANPPATSLGLIPVGATTEGFLFPEAHLLDRGTTAEQLVATLVQGFQDALPAEYPAEFAKHGLTTYQAVILASILQREAVIAEELPAMASVFYNRLAVEMKLQTDPTVQYALGYKPAQGTWWTNPLTSADMTVDSPFNTYLYPGLPPAPICNPGMEALTAVAYPAETPYYYFQASCDKSGWHNFAETYEQHQQNNCP